MAVYFWTPIMLQFLFISVQTYIIFVMTDRELGHMVQKQSPETQFLHWNLVDYKYGYCYKIVQIIKHCCPTHVLNQSAHKIYTV